MANSFEQTNKVLSYLKSNIIGLGHIGYIVQDLSSAINDFKKLYGLNDKNITIVPPYDVKDEKILSRFAFIDVADTTFELIQPLGEPYLTLLNNSSCAGGGLNHIAWHVKDLEIAIENLANKGIKLGHVTPDGIVTLPTKRMAYLDPLTTGGLLVELIEFIEVKEAI